MTSPLESKIDKLNAANPELLKPLLIKAIKALEQVDLYARINHDKPKDYEEITSETLQEINNALGVV